METCVFCNIVANKLPSYKVYESKTHIAFLDIFPNTTGQTLVIPKIHTNAYIYDQEQKVIYDLLDASKLVAKLIEKALKVSKVATVFEGTGVDHLHAHLYPLYIPQDSTLYSKIKPVFYTTYPGYISTIPGKKADVNKLKTLANKINSFTIN